MAKHNPEVMAQLVMKLFDARTSAHVQHLATRSYSTHMALGGFYSEIGDKADSIAESYQGTTGALLSLPDPAPLEQDPLASLQQLQLWIDQNRNAACSDSEIQNLIDEALDLINSTMYKLRFLK